jgi:hypothetical protein
MTQKTIAVVSVLALFLAGCGEGDACGSGQVDDDDACAPEETGGAAGAGSAAAAAGAGGGNGNAGATSEAFGAVCTEHTGCSAPTDYCALPPGMPGYCTAKGCDTNPALCPVNWICFDVGQVVPGEPWICAPPR